MKKLLFISALFTLILSSCAREEMPVRLESLMLSDTLLHLRVREAGKLALVVVPEEARNNVGEVVSCNVVGDADVQVVALTSYGLKIVANSPGESTLYIQGKYMHETYDSPYNNYEYVGDYRVMSSWSSWTLRCTIIAY